MDKEPIHGQMGVNMKVRTKMIRSMDLEYIFGQMEGSTKVTGLMGNSMEVGSLSKGKRRGKAFGRRAKGSNGWRIALMRARILKNEQIFFI